ncbi:hypothetical protein FBU30_010496 [Linnemannia zychae]|nr:hypothetical protein FBU30_010496 [Linnemannia zychae]
MVQSDPHSSSSPTLSSTTASSASTRLRVEPEDTFLRDTTNRAWLLRGVNLSGSSKFPRYPIPVPSHQGGAHFLQPRIPKQGHKNDSDSTGVVTPTTSNAPDSNGNDSDEEAGRHEGDGSIWSSNENIKDHGIRDQTKQDENSDGSISFVGRPFELHEADEHLGRLRHWGFRMIRWVVTWEAVEHAGPGIYDQDFLDYTVKALLKAKEYGFRVMIDFHQDVWSRFSGGSGAPLWTFYAAGLDPYHFAATGAASVHNTLQPHEPLLRMVWLTNYYKLACATMFTLFYAGKILAPNCTFDNGVNIQDYLQSHFLGAIKALVERIHACKDNNGKNLLEDEVVLGYDSWNEPTNGWIGLERLDILPEQHDMRQGDMPTPFQSLMLGEGMTVQNVATYALELVGPVKTGSRTIQPSAHPDAIALLNDQRPIKAWLHPIVRSEIDQKYSFKRDKCFPRAGECLWAQHGVWSTRECKILQQDYFARGPLLASGEKSPLIQWVPNHWLPFAKKVTQVVRAVHPTAILFLEPPVYVPAPDLISEARAAKNGDAAPNQILLENMVYTPHHYDDFVLLTKKYLGWISVDLLGLSRGRHKSLYGSFVLGKKATELLFGNQIGEIQKECYERLGKRPVLIGETGLHFDVGLSKSQQAGNFRASSTEPNGSNNETPSKPGFWSSFWSTPNKKPLACPDISESRNGLPVQSNQFERAFDNILQGLDRTMAHYTLWNYTIESTKQYGDGWNGEDLSLYSVRAAKDPNVEITLHPLDRGGRAVEQFCRPYPVATVGQPTRITFDRHIGSFKLTTEYKTPKKVAQGDGGKTEIYLPQLHFPEGPFGCNVQVSDGTWEWDIDRQLLFWTYDCASEPSDEHWIQVSRKPKA